MAEGQQQFPYTAGGLSELAHTLSDSRLSTYLKAGNHNRERAMGLYLWNARLSKAMRFPLEIAEVTVRNRIHYALTDRWGSDWPKHADFRATAADKSIEAIDDVFAQLGTARKAADVVGRLSFGFWAAILKSRFVETLWRNRLERFFPHLPNQSLEDQLHLLIQKMETARAVRNRIGHLEPIFRDNLSATHSDVLQLIGFACRATAGWTRHHSTFQRVLREGAAGAVKVGPVLHGANKKPTEVSIDTSVPEAMKLLGQKGVGYLLVENSGAWHVIDHDSIGRWASTYADEGIVDLTEWALSDVAKESSPAPLLPRSALVAELLVALGFKSKTPLRYGIVTENGKAGDKVLGVADMHDFVG